MTACREEAADFLGEEPASDIVGVLVPLSDGSEAVAWFIPTDEAIGEVVVFSAADCSILFPAG